MLSGSNLYDIDVEGSICKNGKLGKVIYDKILADQKRLYSRQPMPGFRKGTIPPQIMPRIKYAAIEQLCSQTCEAALEEEGIQMEEGQTELSTNNGLEFPGFDVTPGSFDENNSHKHMSNGSLLMKESITCAGAASGSRRRLTIECVFDSSLAAEVGELEQKTWKRRRRRRRRRRKVYSKLTQ